MSNTRKARGVPGEDPPVTGTPIDLEKMRSIGYLSRGQTRNKIREFRDPGDGHRIKETTDELNNTVTEHSTPDDRVDALVRPQHVKMHISEINGK